MYTRNDESYHAMRAEQERLMAEEATDPRIAALHLELASRYAELAGDKKARAPSLRTG